MGTQTFPNGDTRVQTELALVSFRTSFNCRLHREVVGFFFFFWPPHLPRQTSLPSLGFLSPPFPCSCHLCSTYPCLMYSTIHSFASCLLSPGEFKYKGPPFGLFHPLSHPQSLTPRRCSIVTTWKDSIMPPYTRHPKSRTSFCLCHVFRNAFVE